MTVWRRWLIGVGTFIGIGLAELKQTWLVTQLFTTAGSMFISLLAYAYAFGWQFAAGFVFLLFAHEWGHLIAVRLLGIGSKGPLFIPFLGAVIQLRRPPANAKIDAGIALAGPAMGSLSALLCLIVYVWTEEKIWLVLAYTGCMLNLFNLIPCGPLDGGRIVPAISTKLWIVGLIVLSLIFIKTWNPLLGIVLLFSVLRLVEQRKESVSGNYFFVPMLIRCKIALWYFGILAVLGIATIYTYQLLQ